MKRDHLKPETKPAVNRPPPRPPHRTARGLIPGDEDPGKKQRFGKRWRATTTKVANGEGKFIRSSGSSGHYAYVQVRVVPNQKGKGIGIIYEAHSNEIPAKFSKSVTDGVRFALEDGITIGHPAVDEHPIDDIVVHVVGGSYHETDSSDLDFKLAGIFAVKDAVKKAEPVVIKQKA